MASNNLWWLSDLGQKSFKETHQLQVALAQARHQRRLQKNLGLLVEHPAVFTVGKRGNSSNFKVDGTFLLQRGLEVVPIERGGDITYHGPGQLVCYLILNLKEQGFDIRDFVRSIEEVMTKTCRDFGVLVNRDPRNPGVWVGDAKLGSLGIAVRRGITFHGFSINVNNDLTPFEWINPCGLKNISVTSISKQMDQHVEIPVVKKRITQNMASVFAVQFEPIDPVQLSDLAKG